MRQQFANLLENKKPTSKSVVVLIVQQNEAVRTDVGQWWKSHRFSARWRFWCRSAYTKLLWPSSCCRWWGGPVTVFVGSCGRAGCLVCTCCSLLQNMRKVLFLNFSWNWFFDGIHLIAQTSLAKWQKLENAFVLNSTVFCLTKPIF